MGLVAWAGASQPLEDQRRQITLSVTDDLLKNMRKRESFFCCLLMQIYFSFPSIFRRATWEMV